MKQDLETTLNNISKAIIGMERFKENTMIRETIMKTYIREVDHLKLDYRAPYVAWLDKYVNDCKRDDSYRNHMKEQRDKAHNHGRNGDYL